MRLDKPFNRQVRRIAPPRAEKNAWEITEDEEGNLIAYHRETDTSRILVPAPVPAPLAAEEEEVE